MLHFSLIFGVAMRLRYFLIRSCLRIKWRIGSSNHASTVKDPVLEDLFEKWCCDVGEYQIEQCGCQRFEEKVGEYLLKNGGGGKRKGGEKRAGGGEKRAGGGKKRAGGEKKRAGGGKRAEKRAGAGKKNDLGAKTWGRTNKSPNK